MAMYQDRIFAFTPQGELIQLPKGATPVDFAYAVHTDLGDQTVGAKINGRVVPLRTQIKNGDQVQILRSKAQEPQAGWMSFAITGKARAAIRRHRAPQGAVPNRSRSAGSFYDEIVRACPHSSPAMRWRRRSSG
jgi:guanosine-3',5'-bis(diphosphate) 3'-pyrophosphohydrolase